MRNAHGRYEIVELNRFLILMFLIGLLIGFLSACQAGNTFGVPREKEPQLFQKITPYCLAQERNLRQIYDARGRPLRIPGSPTRFVLKPYEDRVIRISFLLENGERVFVHGVFDGHVDADVSEYLASNLAPWLADRMTEELKDGDSHWTIRNLIIRVILDMDSYICREARLIGGSTMSIVVRYRDAAYVINVGDSKTYVFQRNILCHVTRDHYPLDQFEKQFVERAGGTVSEDARINGLAMSRALGDCKLKMSEKDRRSGQRLHRAYSGTDGLVRAYPDVEIISLEKDTVYSFLYDTDGIFEEGPNMLLPPIDDSKVHSLWKWRHWSPLYICQRLSHEADQRGSLDDITVLVVETTDKLADSFDYQ